MLVKRAPPVADSDPELIELLQLLAARLGSMSTGDGSLCTVHARSASQAIDRLVTLAMSAGVGITDTFAYRLLSGAVDLLVHIQLLDETALGGRRHRFVSQVLEVNGIGESSRPALTIVFGPGQDGRAVPMHQPAFLPDLVRAGFDPGFLDARSGTWTTPLSVLTTFGHRPAAPAAPRGRYGPQSDCTATTEKEPVGGGDL